ncbi:UPF0758 protein [Altererythrobacter insulae]|nr:UPF0758 protein [Altererythrobacter insulae]
MTLSYPYDEASRAGANVRFPSIFAYLRQSFAAAHTKIERLHLVFLDRERRYLDDYVMIGNSSASVPVRMRDIFKHALRIDASGLLAAHNHPSGDCRPSDTDIFATKRLQEIGHALDIELHDHLIFTREKVYSMRAGGKL